MLDELTIALKEMVDVKFSSLDGYLCEFYKAKWDFVGSKLLQVYKEVIRSLTLGDHINKD